MSTHKPQPQPPSPPIASFPPIDTSSTSPTNSSITNPPRPNIPPGHAGTVRTPHPHDVLSGRGGRINSHPGNVHFREIIDAYKRQYLDPRTKKTEKARIAARIVQSVRTLEPGGRFLKEDPHTGLWMEIGDERAWKKAGQALRESAPEIRAERQMKLQMLAGVGVGMVDPIVAGGGGTGIGGIDGIGGGSRSGGGSGSKSSGSRKSRQADPPGPRHRPNPPEREGLAAVKWSNSRVNAANNYINNNNDVDQRQTSTHNSASNRQAQQQAIDEDADAELTRMRQEYYQMQRLQQEQQRRMEQYQIQLQQQQQQHQIGNAGSHGGAGNDRVYDEYNQMQQGLLMGNYRQQIHQEAQAQLAARGEMSNRDGQQGQGQQQLQQQGQRYSNHRDIAAAIMDDGLLPVNAGFDIPALRGEIMPPQQQQQQYQQYLQQQQQQQQQNQNQEQFSPNYNQEDYNHPEAFADRHFNACDKTVSTMSSFDMQSMDMSSLGGFSWNQSAYNTSGLISTGDNTQTTHSSRYNNYNASGTIASNGGKGGAKSKSKSKKSALERKLEKVNEKHHRQQMQEMQYKQQHAQASQGMIHPTMEVPTVGGMAHQKQQQQQQKQNNNNQRSHKYSQENKNMMASLNSFGFEAIEEDEHSKASEYKMSNLGLSGLSEMDMTFSSDVMSVRSKSVPKTREKSGDGGAGSGNANRMASIEDSGSAQKRSSSVDVDGDSNAGITASSVFNQSLSSASERSVGSTSHKSFSMNNNNVNMKNYKSSLNMSMEDFNESFKSMETDDQRSVLSKKTPLDPDGAVGGPSQRSAQSQPSPARRKDPRGGRLTTIHSGRGSDSAAHGASSTSNNNANANARLSSNNSNNRRRTSIESMGISDLDMLTQFGASTASRSDFGLSLGSFRSFQSNDSNASSWMNQYNSMENIEGGGSALWDDEDQAQASDGTSMSEISAPRMVTATGGDA